MIKELKIGDRIIGKARATEPRIANQTGTIVLIEDEGIIVNFDNDIQGWDEPDLGIPDGHGLYVDIDDIELLKGLKLQVRYIDKNLTPMQKIAKGDLVDLRASRVFSVVWSEEKQENEKIEKQFPYRYKAGETLFIKLGFAMRLPENKKANVYPRSGLFNNYGLILTNSVGML